MIAMDEKGWVTLDFLATLIIVFLTIQSIVAIVSERIETVNSIEDSGEAKILVENIAETLETVYTNGEGYYTIYKMPPTISGELYTIDVNSREVLIKFNGKTGCAHLTSMKISNSIYYDSQSVQMNGNQAYNISNHRDEHENVHIIIKQI
jgi:hypothetical protein